MRPVALGRKNALFAGADSGGRHWAIVATLLQTAKLNEVDPLAWLTDVLERIVAGHTKLTSWHRCCRGIGRPPRHSKHRAPPSNANARADPLSRIMPIQDHNSRDRRHVGGPQRLPFTSHSIGIFDGDAVRSGGIRCGMSSIEYVGQLRDQRSGLCIERTDHGEWRAGANLPGRAPSLTVDVTLLAGHIPPIAPVRHVSFPAGSP